MKWRTPLTIVLLCMLVLASQLAIALLVAEWRTDDSTGPTAETTSVHAEWVSCVSSLQADSSFFPDEEYINESVVQGLIEGCEITGPVPHLWVRCINEGFDRGNPDLVLTVGEAHDIARSCERQLETE